MGTYSVLLVDGPLTAEMQSVLRSHDRLDGLESSWDRYHRYETDEPLTEADKTFWILQTDVNSGVRHWEFLRSEFVDTIRQMVPDAAVYLVNDYMLQENTWTRAQWLDIAEGRHQRIHPSHVEMLTDEAIAKWDLAAAKETDRSDGVGVPRDRIRRVDEDFTLAESATRQSDSSDSLIERIQNDPHIHAVIVRANECPLDEFIRNDDSDEGRNNEVGHP